jgi:hypothetical protein
MKLSPPLTSIVPVLTLLLTSSAIAGSQPAPQAPTAGTGPAGALVLISGTDADGIVRSAAGFVVDASGTIATTLHGLRGLVKASVRLANGDSYDLTHVRAFDDAKDLAIVQIPAFGVPASELGNSDALAAGDALTTWTIPLGGESHAAPTSIADIQRAEGARIGGVSDQNGGAIAANETDAEDSQLDGCVHARRVCASNRSIAGTSSCPNRLGHLIRLRRKRGQEHDTDNTDANYPRSGEPLTRDQFAFGNTDFWNCTNHGVFVWRNRVGSRR